MWRQRESRSPDGEEEEKWKRHPSLVVSYSLHDGKEGEWGEEGNGDGRAGGEGILAVIPRKCFHFPSICLT
jgi:hypothetical protein